MNDYIVCVRTLIAKLVVLVAVILMPLGMGSAAASAPATDHHEMMAGTAMEHCPDQPNKHERTDGLAVCSMACASGLPAQDVARADSPIRQRQLVVPIIGHTLTGIQPEIATPPPKLS